MSQRVAYTPNSLATGNSSIETAKITRWLHGWRAGDPQALKRLTEAVYGELRQLAARRMRSESAGHTLRPTELVHEAFLRVAQADIPWADRVHFFAVVASTMRRVLVDHAKTKGRVKRGAGAVRVTLQDSGGPGLGRSVDLLDLDRALSELAELDAAQARLVELYYFSGMTLQEISQATDTPVSSTHRLLRSARAWIHRRFEPAGGGSRQAT